MRRPTPATRSVGGFTLVELAVVLVLLGLVIGMLAIPLSTQVEQQRMAETQRHLEQAREALIGFALATGRLPCPALPTLGSSAPGAGAESRSGGTCGAAVLNGGVLPWATLGVAETDAWGNRLTYRAASAFADDADPGLQASFLLTDDGNIVVTNGSITIADTLVAVVVSHGKNGLGAYRSDGTQLTGAVGDELRNTDATLTYVSRTHAPDFDDQLVWLPPSILKSRMVAAGRLP
jgi:type II secretory pathway pseudopilin PulG